MTGQKKKGLGQTYVSEIEIKEVTISQELIS
jgi:hypothetical protein